MMMPPQRAPSAVVYAAAVATNNPAGFNSSHRCRRRQLLAYGTGPAYHGTTHAAAACTPASAAAFSTSEEIRADATPMILSRRPRARRARDTEGRGLLWP